MQGDLDVGGALVKVKRLRLRLAELDRQVGVVDRLLGQVVKLALELYRARAWKAFGLSTWAELVETERLVLSSLGGSARVSVAMELSAGNLSLRAIAPVLGVSHETVNALLAKGVAEGGTLPSVRLSLDGKMRRIAPARPRNVIAGELVPSDSDSDSNSDSNEGIFDVEGFLADVGALGVDHGPSDAAVLAELQLRELMDSIRNMGTSELVVRRLPEAHPARRRRLAAQFHAAAELMSDVARQWGVAA
ncbi:hypothetical protein [Arthrobacter sp. FW306-2-2C-D06B]|uniref:hypothetical protein n=1 Tax=Arthrobacter sp. FW306-2-2C-D06B TaxID=2879618 RepID=UPI001F3309FD|nr:hypothetical protein [Arthrobacter sp. FW306-2-2C-D06B]UKA57016.1 hypothetical protein LFT47_11850 [Arthrobacter sp. FW306-2-2C-D06B]